MPVKTVRGIVNKLGFEDAVKFVKAHIDIRTSSVRDVDHLEHLVNWYGDEDKLAGYYNEEERYGQLDFTIGRSKPWAEEHYRGLGNLSDKRKRRSSRKSNLSGLGKVETYRTFIRSARNWQEFARGRKTTVDRGLTWSEASKACKAYNKDRTSRQISKGTMIEFEAE